jgi:hypothetical protein
MQLSPTLLLDQFTRLNTMELAMTLTLEEASLLSSSGISSMRAGWPLHMLTVRYCMYRHLSAFPNYFTYEGRLPRWEHPIACPRTCSSLGRRSAVGACGTAVSACARASQPAYRMSLAKMSLHMGGHCQLSGVQPSEVIEQVS